MLFFAVAVVSLLLSQTDPLSLSGVVFDTNANPVSEVHIHLEEPTAHQQWDFTTKNDGTFRFDRLTFGTYRLTVQHAGYFDVSTEVRLESSKSVEFTLAPTETVKQEIDVIARPEPINTDSVAPQIVVNDEVIQSIPYTGRQDFLNAVSLMPGVLRDNDNQIHIHGSTPDQVRYQLDGLYLSDPSSGGLMANIPIDAVESVDVDMANYSAEFGKSSGGVVRVNSQFVGDKFRFNVTDFIPGWDFRQKSVAEFSPRMLFSGPIVQKKLWFMYSGTLRYIHSYLEELKTPVDERSSTQTTSDQLLKLQWNLKESHVLTMEMLHNSEYLGNVGIGVVRPLETTTNFLRRGNTLAVSDRYIAGGKVLESTVQLSRRHDSDLAKGTAPLEIQPDMWTGNYFADRREHVQRFHTAQSITWERQAFGFAHRIKAGGEFDHVSSSIQLDDRPHSYFNEDRSMASYVTFEGDNFADTQNREYGGFVQDRITLNRRLQVEAGLRYDRESLVGRNNFGPRAAFSFLPFGTNRSKVSGGIGLYYDNIDLLSVQLPNLQRRVTTLYKDGVQIDAPSATTVLVSPELRNPRTMHWHLSWDHEWAPRWVSRINYIEKNGRDYVRLAAQPFDSGFDLIFNNSGTSHYRGIELTLDRPIRTNLRIVGSYTYSSAKARPPVLLDIPDPNVEYIPESPVDWNTPHRFVGWGYFPLPSHLTGAFSVEARSGFPFTVVDELNRVVGSYNGQKLPAYFVTNASLEKEIPIPFGNGKRVAFRVSVTNLFNRFNPRFVDRNLASPYFLGLSESSSRHFSARVRILKK